MQHIRIITTCLLFIQLLILRLYAQVPPGYYDPANGKTGIELQSALHEIIKGHTVQSYDFLWTAFETTDDKPNGDVWDMYSDIPGGNPPYAYQFGFDQCGNYNSEGDCYNREHSWPKSWFNDLPPMNSDLFHIYPTDGYVNNKRDNYPYGTVGLASWTSQNGSKLGSCSWPGFSGTVFEPRDEYKGDFARTFFYMSTRYYAEDASWDITDMTIRSQLKPWALQMMLHWSNTDTVSQKEIDRNNTVYGLQQNRNPFIDHPEYATMIWGFPVGAEQRSTTVRQVQIFPNPVTASATLNIDQLPAGRIDHITIYDITGQAVNSSCVIVNTTIRIDAGNLPAGFYLVVVESTFDHVKYRGILIKS